MQKRFFLPLLLIAGIIMKSNAQTDKSGTLTPDIIKEVQQS